MAATVGSLEDAIKSADCAVLALRACSDVHDAQLDFLLSVERGTASAASSIEFPNVMESPKECRPQLGLESERRWSSFDGERQAQVCAVAALARLRATNQRPQPGFIHSDIRPPGVWSDAVSTPFPPPLAEASASLSRGHVNCSTVSVGSPWSGWCAQARITRVVQLVCQLKCRPSAMRENAVGDAPQRAVTVFLALDRGPTTGWPTRSLTVCHRHPQPLHGRAPGGAV
ncbi:hypothetical protein, variant 1 [Aphanomyces invadans]|nr:hypothetical protein, variant 1 [Aphanomyces invadans]ETV93522.1 hypothetical protein, variant 1 [Aphanomyces invadans]|eukprot:XP_008877864.1 hypothetical protein, variant 1 [Aphanomyces invadans]